MDNRVVSPANGTSEVSAKDRLTAGLVARDTDNNDVVSVPSTATMGGGGNDGDDELDNGKSIPVVSVGTKKAGGRKKRQKKRPVHGSAANSSANSSNNSVVLDDELDNGAADLVNVSGVNASNRFSDVSGLCKPNR